MKNCARVRACLHAWVAHRYFEERTFCRPALETPPWTGSCLVPLGIDCLRFAGRGVLALETCLGVTSANLPGDLSCQVEDLEKDKSRV